MVVVTSTNSLYVLPDILTDFKSCLIAFDMPFTKQYNSSCIYFLKVYPLHIPIFVYLCCCILISRPPVAPSGGGAFFGLAHVVALPLLTHPSLIIHRQNYCVGHHRHGCVSLYHQRCKGHAVFRKVATKRRLSSMS